MLTLRVCLLWFLVALHIVGGAALFTRVFKRESPWFGFVVPALAIAIAMNFLEHYVGFSSIRCLLPITCVGSIWILNRARAANPRMPSIDAPGSPNAFIPTI